MNIQYIHPADQLVMFMQRIYDKGLTTMSGGNLSIRDTEGNIWITPAGIDKGTLTRKDIICVIRTAPARARISRRPSCRSISRFTGSVRS